MEILAIIPARGGSKSIPRKNIKNLGTKPMIAWSIEAALKSNIDRVIVTTDDKEIAEVAKKYGAKTPFIRPSELAQDTTPTEPVLKHTLEWLKENENYTPDAVVLLQPTSPLRQAEHINEAIKIFKQKNPDCLISVHEAIANNNPHWILKRDENNKIILATGEPLSEIKNRRQDLPAHYIRNDIIYVFKPQNLFMEKPGLYGKGDKVELYVINDPSNYEADINTLDEWDDANKKLRKLTQK